MAAPGAARPARATPQAWHSPGGPFPWRPAPGFPEGRGNGKGKEGRMFSCSRGSQSLGPPWGGGPSLCSPCSPRIGAGIPTGKGKEGGCSPVPIAASSRDPHGAGGFPFRTGSAPCSHGIDPEYPQEEGAPRIPVGSSLGPPLGEFPHPCGDRRTPPFPVPAEFLLHSPNPCHVQGLFVPSGSTLRGTDPSRLPRPTCGDAFKGLHRNLGVLEAPEFQSHPQVPMEKLSFPPTSNNIPELCGKAPVFP